MLNESTASIDVVICCHMHDGLNDAPDRDLYSDDDGDAPVCDEF